jgi:hypothetical protein
MAQGMAVRNAPEGLVTVGGISRNAEAQADRHDVFGCDGNPIAFIFGLQRPGDRL